MLNLELHSLKDWFGFCHQIFCVLSFKQTQVATRRRCLQLKMSQHAARTQNLPKCGRRCASSRRWPLIGCGRNASSVYIHVLLLIPTGKPKPKHIQASSAHMKELGFGALHIKLRATGGTKTRTPGPGMVLRYSARAGFSLYLFEPSHARA